MKAADTIIEMLGMAQDSVTEAQAQLDRTSSKIKAELEGHEAYAKALIQGKFPDMTTAQRLQSLAASNRQALDARAVLRQAEAEFETATARQIDTINTVLVAYGPGLNALASSVESFASGTQKEIRFTVDGLRIEWVDGVGAVQHYDADWGLLIEAESLSPEKLKAA